MAKGYQVEIVLAPRYLGNIPHFYKPENGQVGWTQGSIRGYHYKKDAVEVQKEIELCGGKAEIKKL